MLNKILFSFLSLILLSSVLPAYASSESLIKNGSFETPIVTNSKGWDLYPDGTTGVDWTVNWAGTYPGAPTANIELQKSGNLPNTDEIPDGWIARDGNQYAELDSGWTGGGEVPASIKISQTVPTCKGSYELKFSWANRPVNRYTKMRVYWNDVQVGPELSGIGGSATNWRDVDTTLTSNGGNSTLRFEETGYPDAYGMYLDNVSLVATDVDCDNDTVSDTIDMCPNTTPDELTSEQGVNRWIWNGNWVTVAPKGKGPQNNFTMGQTLGCNCTQILDNLKAATGDQMLGLYKFGCTQGVLENWIKSL